MRNKIDDGWATIDDDCAALSKEMDDGWAALSKEMNDGWAAIDNDWAIPLEDKALSPDEAPKRDRSIDKAETESNDEVKSVPSDRGGGESKK